MRKKIITSNINILNRYYINGFDNETIKRFSNIVSKIKEQKKANGQQDDFLYFVARAIHAMEASAIDASTGEYDPKLGHIDKNDGTGKCAICGVELRKDKDGNYIDGMWCKSSKVKPYYNQNGDAFPEEELIKLIIDPECPNKKIPVYETFIGKGLFTDHKSNQVECLRGIILDAVYDKKTKGVDVLVALDKVQYPELARQISIGYSCSVSMGCKVKYAICGICGNISYTLNDLCSCAKINCKNQRLLTKDNTEPYQINYGVEFIELSVVSIGADPKAKIKKIVAKNNKESELVSLAKKFGGVNMKYNAKLFSCKDFSKWVVYANNTPVFELTDKDVFGEKIRIEDREYFKSKEYGSTLLKAIKSDGIDTFRTKIASMIKKTAQNTKQDNIENKEENQDVLFPELLQDFEKQKGEQQEVSEQANKKDEVKNEEKQEIQEKEEQKLEEQQPKDEEKNKDSETQKNDKSDVINNEVSVTKDDKLEKQDKEQLKEDVKEEDKQEDKTLSDEVSAIKMSVTQIKDAIDNILSIIDTMKDTSNNIELDNLNKDLKDTKDSIDELIKTDETKLDKESIALYKDLLKYSIDYSSLLIKEAYDKLLIYKFAKKNKKEKIDDKKDVMEDKNVNSVINYFKDNVETQKEILDMINNRIKSRNIIAQKSDINEKVVEHKKQLLFKDVGDTLLEYFIKSRDIEKFEKDINIKDMFNDEFMTREKLSELLDIILSKYNKENKKVAKNVKIKKVANSKKINKELNNKIKNNKQIDKEVDLAMKNRDNKNIKAVDEAMKRIFNDIKEDASNDESLKKFFEDSIKEFRSMESDKKQKEDKDKPSMRDAHLLAYKRAELGMIPNTPDAIIDDIEDLMKLDKQTFLSLQSIVNRTKKEIHASDKCIMVGRQTNVLESLPSNNLYFELKKILG